MRLDLLSSSVPHLGWTPSKGKCKLLLSDLKVPALYYRWCNPVFQAVCFPAGWIIDVCDSVTWAQASHGSSLCIRTVSHAGGAPKRKKYFISVRQFYFKRYVSLMPIHAFVTSPFVSFPLQLHPHLNYCHPLPVHQMPSDFSSFPQRLTAKPILPSALQLPDIPRPCDNLFQLFSSVLQILNPSFPTYSLSICPKCKFSFLLCVFSSELLLPVPLPAPAC